MVERKFYSAVKVKLFLMKHTNKVNTVKTSSFIDFPYFSYAKYIYCIYAMSELHSELLLLTSG